MDMDTQLLNLERMWPELIVVAAGLGVILAEILGPRDRRSLATPLVAGLGLLAALGVLVLGRGGVVAEGEGAAAMMVRLVSVQEGFDHLVWKPDPFAWFARVLVVAGGLLTVLLSIPYTRRLDRGHGEFYALFLFALLGVMLVSGVSDLLSLFICLELVTITSYVLAAFKRTDLRATEAGLKYLVIGAVSSAVLLLGIALVYGAAGDVTFEAVRAALTPDAAGAGAPVLLVAGLVLLVVGILFKVGAVPFHVWIPDVYQGAPSPVVAFLSTGSKAAGLIVLLRVAGEVLVPWAEAPGGFLWVWVLGGLAAITVVFGLLGALPQRSMKRFFGYSSIGHAGYLLMGAAAIAVGADADRGATAVLFYLLAFVFTNLTAFTVIVLISRATGGRHESVSYMGLWKRAPFLALAMALALLSLAGIPPLSGFFGKFLVLRAVVEAWPTAGWGLLALAFLGALGVAVSLYFYLRWIREMYFEDPEPMVADVPVPVGPWASVVLVVGIVAMLAMGIYMGPFYDLAQNAATAVVTP